jgi:hypothetical protein
MNLKPIKKRSLRSFAGFIVIVSLYIGFLLTASVLYPVNFNPLTDTLSQLGNPKLNPSGAIFYNIGVFMICFPLFLSALWLLFHPKRLLLSDNSRRRSLLYLTLGCMIVFTFFDMLMALIPTGINDALNSLFALVFLISFELFVLFSTMGIRNREDHVRLIPLVGYVVAILNFVLLLLSILTHLPIVSWLIAVNAWSYMTAFVYEFSSV